MSWFSANCNKWLSVQCDMNGPSKSLLLASIMTYLSQASEPPEGISQLEYTDHPGETKGWGYLHSTIH